MIRRFLAAYLLIELAAVIGLIWWIGFGPTLLVLIAAMLIGLLVAGTQLRRQLARLMSREFGRTAAPGGPAGAVTDSALIALGTVLVSVPGLVSSLLGMAMLVSPTRAALRPAATALAARSLTKRVVFADIGARGFGAGRADYIEGEVIETVWLGDEQPSSGPTGQLPGRVIPPAQ